MMLLTKYTDLPKKKKNVQQVSLKDRFMEIELEKGRKKEAKHSCP